MSKHHLCMGIAAVGIAGSRCVGEKRGLALDVDGVVHQMGVCLAQF
jgi:hypothetical protein